MANPRIKKGVGESLTEMLEEVTKEREKRTSSQIPTKRTVKRLEDEDPLYDRG